MDVAFVVITLPYLRHQHHMRARDYTPDELFLPYAGRRASATVALGPALYGVYAPYQALDPVRLVEL